MDSIIKLMACWSMVLPRIGSLWTGTKLESHSGRQIQCQMSLPKAEWAIH